MGDDKLINRAIIWTHGQKSKNYSNDLYELFRNTISYLEYEASVIVYMRKGFGVLGWTEITNRQQDVTYTPIDDSLLELARRHPDTGIVTAHNHPYPELIIPSYADLVTSLRQSITCSAAGIPFIDSFVVQRDRWFSLGFCHSGPRK